MACHRQPLEPHRGGQTVEKPRKFGDGNERAPPRQSCPLGTEQFDLSRRDTDPPVVRLRDGAEIVKDNCDDEIEKDEASEDGEGDKEERRQRRLLDHQLVH